MRRGGEFRGVAIATAALQNVVKRSSELIQRWLLDPKNRSDRYGKFRYSLEPFGISADEMDEIFRPYRERFDIPREIRVA